MPKFEDITDSVSSSLPRSSSISNQLVAKLPSTTNISGLSSFFTTTSSWKKPALFISLYLLSQYISKGSVLQSVTKFDAKTVSVSDNNSITYIKSISRYSDRRVITFTLTSSYMDITLKSNDELFEILINQFELNEHEKSEYKVTRHWWMPKSVTTEREIRTDDGALNIQSKLLNYSRILFGSFGVFFSALWFKQLIFPSGVPSLQTPSS